MTDEGGSDADPLAPLRGHWGGRASAASNHGPVANSEDPNTELAPPGLTLPGPRLKVTLALLLGWMLVTMLGGIPLIDGQEGVGHFLLSNLALNIAAAAAFILFAGHRLGLLGRWFAAPLPRTFGAIWFPMLYLCLLAVAAIAVGMPPLAEALILALNCLFVGLSEEAMFRGLLYRGLRSRKGVLAAALLSSLAFGAIHIMNAILSGDLIAAFAQSVFAALFGLVAVAMMLRSGSLILPILYHGAWDFFTIIVTDSAMQNGGPPPGPMAMTISLFVPAILALPMALQALWLIRRLPRHAEALARA